MKVQLIARVAHEINRAYCASLGDDTQVAWEDTPEWQQKSAIAGVEMHLANPDATPEQSHEGWLAQKLADGWTYGEVKDAEAKRHPCCVPYEDLPAEQKAKDHIFRAVVHELKRITEGEIKSAVAQGAASVQSSTIPVKYIGRRPEWHDRIYGTGLSFVTGQVRNMPGDIAYRLLRHADLFEVAAKDSVIECEPTPERDDDDTAELLEKGAQAKEEAQQELGKIHDLYDQIEQMGKDSLIEFAATKYMQKLDKRSSVDSLRTQVRQFVDQFGAV